MHSPQKKPARPFEVKQRNGVKVAVYISNVANQKKEATYHTPKEESHGQQKLVLSKGWKQTSGWHKKQWTKADKKETRCGDATSSSHETGLQLKDKTVLWQKTPKESQKREDELVHNLRIKPSWTWSKNMARTSVCGQHVNKHQRMSSGTFWAQAVCRLRLLGLGQASLTLKAITT